MLISSTHRGSTHTLLVCLCVIFLVAGCDRRKYSTSVYNSEETANSSEALLNDPTTAGNAADSENGSAIGNTPGSEAGLTTEGASDSTTGNAGESATGSAGGSATGSTGGSTTGSAGGSATGSATDGATGTAIDGAPGSTNASTTDDTSSNSIDTSLTVDPSATLADTVTDPDVPLPSISDEVAAPSIVDAGQAETADTLDVEPPEPAELPGQVPVAVPQGPKVDRIGSGSIYQPFADVETATSTIDGRRSLAIAAVGGPVLQSPRALMEGIDEYFLNDANQVAFSGRFSVADEPAYGVWAGDADSPVQIFQTGTAIPGLTDGQTYFKTLKLALANDGSLAQVVEVKEEATLTQAYMVSRGNTHNVLMRTDSTIPGLIGPVKIDSIEVASQSPNANALVSLERTVTKVPVEEKVGVTVNEEDGDEGPEEIDVVTRQYSVWYLANGATKAIAHSWTDKPQSAPRLSNGCRVYAPDNTVDNVRLGVTPDASLVFQAQVGGDGGCDQGRAVMRYNGNRYEEVVKDGDTVPGSTTHVFNDVSLYTVADDGSAIVFANLTTPVAIAEALATEQAEPDAAAIRLAELTGVETEQEIDSGKWSFWLMPPEGGARLIALEGEEIQVGPTISVFSGEPRNLSLQLNGNNQMALKLLLDDAEQPVFFVGVGHTGQPHGSIDLPGASALQYAFTGNSALPGQNNDAVLGALGTPYVDVQGNLVIYGEVNPSDEAVEAAKETSPAGAEAALLPLITPFNSLWQVDSTGTMRELVRSGDQVAVAGVNKTIASLSVAGQIARPGTAGVRVNSAGAMLLRATIERKFGNPVLLYIAP